MGSGHELFEHWPYPKMRLKDIAALPIEELAGPSCHMWLWTVNGTIPHAVWLMQQWKFTYMTTITWVKQSGWGYWWANCTEHLMFGYKGKLVMKDKLKPTAFHHPRSTVHSQKPDKQFEYIEAISHGPYLEMFARRQREGWDVWGDEVEGVDIWKQATKLS